MLLALLPAGMAGAGEWLAASEAPMADGAWRFSARSDQHSDALPLAALGDDDWSRLTPRPGRNLAYLDEELRLQRRSGAWTFGLLARQYATVVASRESLELAAMIDAGQRPAADAQWQADVEFRGFSGTGAVAVREWSLASAWTLALSAQALVLGRWRQRSIGGPVQYDAAADTYAFALQSVEHDNRLDFPFQQPFAARGAGLLLGAELTWHEGAWSARAALIDGGWLHWRGMPQQQATLDTAAQGLDPDGFLLYLPLVQGSNSQAGLTRWQPWRGRFALDRALGHGHWLGVTVDTVPGFGALPALRWQQDLGATRLGLGWRLHERRATLALAWRGWQLQAGADRWGAEARSRDLALAWQTAL